MTRTDRVERQGDKLLLPLATLLVLLFFALGFAQRFLWLGMASAVPLAAWHSLTHRHTDV